MRINVVPNASSGGGSLLAATQLQIVLQGQTQQNAGTFNSGTGDYTPQAQGSCSIVWQANGPTPDSWNIYRSDGQAAYHFLTNVSDASRITAYAAYVSNSQSIGWPYQSVADHFFTDSTATTAVGFPKGAGTVEYPATGYTYKVAPVKGGVEGPMSTDTIAHYFVNGQIQGQGTGGIICENVFNTFGTINWAATDGGTTPLGFNTCVKYTTNQASGLINPFVGSGGTRWNFDTTGLNYFNINARTNNVSNTFQVVFLLVGDVTLNTVQSTSYNTFTNTTGWFRFKIPLRPDLMNAQTAWYKCNIQDNGGSGNTYWLETYFSVN